MDNGGRAVVVVLGQYPVPYARQVAGGFNQVGTPPRELGRDFSGLIAYQVRAAVNRRYAGDIAVLLTTTRGAIGFCLYPRRK